MIIALKKDPRFDGVFIASSSKRRVMISQPKIAVICGFAPSDAEVRQAMNDCSRPGDKLADDSTKIIRS